MKRKNLLSLTALCLTLGLVVTSCSQTCDCEPGPQGEQGEKGDQGDAGAPGQPGQNGENGENGATLLNGEGEPSETLGEVGDQYIDTTNMDLWEKTEDGWEKIGSLKGAQGDQGEAGQSGSAGEAGEAGKTYVSVINLSGLDITHPYFVTQGEDVTLTFNFDTSKTQDMVDDLIINGEEVTVTAGSSTLTLSTEEVAYSKGIQIVSGRYVSFLQYAQGLVNDYYDGLVAKDSGLAPRSGTTRDATTNSYYTESVRTLVSSIVDTTIPAEYNKLDSSLTGPERVKAMETVVEAQKKLIDEAYATAITSAKTKAKGFITTLADNLAKAHTSYKAEDKTADINRANAEIEACTTLEALPAVINDVGANLGKYSTFFAAKTEAFDMIAAALGSIKETYDKDLVESWGVSTDVVPQSIAEEYRTKISQDTVMEVNEDGDPVLGVEGAQKITGALTSLKSALLAAIEDRYITEIEDSETLSSPSQKTTGISLIRNAIQEWQVRNPTPEVMHYISTTDASHVSLVEALENAINGYYGAGSSTANAAFLAERVQKHSADRIAALRAKADSIIANDALYAEAIKYTPDTVNNRLYPTKAVLAEVEVSSTVKVQVLNPLYGGLTKDDDGEYFGTGDAINNFSVELIYSKTVQAARGASTVAQLDGIFAGVEDEMEDAYDKARHAFASAALDVLESNGYVGGTSSIPETDWTKHYGPTEDFTMTEVATAFASFASNSQTITGVNTTVDQFLDELLAADPDYELSFDVVGGNTSLRESSVIKEAEDIKDAVLAGTLTEEEMDDIEDTLQAAYEEDVKAYVTDVTALGKELYQNAIVSNITVEQFVEIRDIYEDAESKLTTLTTVTAANNWLKQLRYNIGNVSADQKAPGAILNSNGSMSNANGTASFENSESVKISDPVVQGSTSTYTVSGTPAKMTEEQAKVWSGAADKTTEFVTIKYTTGLTGAQSRRVGWSADGSTIAAEDASIRSIPSDGTQTTVLGTRGSGTVSKGYHYYIVQILSSDVNTPYADTAVLYTYVFYFGDLTKDQTPTPAPTPSNPDSGTGAGTGGAA